MSTQKKNNNLILASSSPRRIGMLADLGYDFECLSPDIDETVGAGETAHTYVQRMAREKAATALKIFQSSCAEDSVPEASNTLSQIILAADTTCAIDDEILGKPEDKADAERMIKMMSGRSHLILTAVTLIEATTGQQHHILSETKIFFRNLSERDIQLFVSQTENWEGKAGAYGLQTSASSALIARVEGSHTGVIGLPLAETVELLTALSVERKG